MSQQLAKLEREAGTQLVQRSGRGIRLTEAAELLAGHAASILSLAERAPLPVPEGLARTLLLEDVADIAVRAAHPLAGRPGADLAEFGPGPWVCGVPGTTCHDWLSFTLRAGGRGHGHGGARAPPPDLRDVAGGVGAASRDPGYRHRATHRSRATIGYAAAKPRTGAWPRDKSCGLREERHADGFLG